MHKELTLSLESSGVSASKTGMRDPLAIKKAAELVAQGAAVLSQACEDDGVSGLDDTCRALSDISVFLKACHLEHVATRTYDASKLVADMEQAKAFLAKMKSEALSKSSDWYVSILEQELSNAVDSLPLAALESDDAVDELLSELAQSVSKLIEYAINSQFDDWNPDHSSYDPYTYQYWGHCLTHHINQMAGIDEER